MTDMTQPADACLRLAPLNQAFFDEFGKGADDVVQDYARVCVKAALQAAMQGWQTIESAPKDGTLIDLFAGQRYPSCRWRESDALMDGVEYWCQLSWHTTYDGWFWIRVDELATHWMPIPAAPTPPTAAETGEA